MTGWGNRVLWGSMIGAAVGVLIGLALSRVLWPATPSPSPALLVPTGTPVEVAPSPALVVVAEEMAAARAEALVMVSALYMLDGDLERARERLAALGLDDPAGEIAELALHHVSAGNEQVATDLATLAMALGHQARDLLTYVATPTPSPTATETPTPVPTETPVPTVSPTPLPPPTLTLPPSSTPAPAAAPPQPTKRPPTVTPLPPVATPLPLVWDHRVDMFSPSVKLVEAEAQPRQTYWRLVRLEWWKANEGGNTMIYVSTISEKGQPVWGQEVIVEHGLQERLHTDPKPGEPYGTNYPMSATLNSYQVYVGGDLPSDRVVGLGLGEWYGGLDHTSFVLVFQRSRK